MFNGKKIISGIAAVLIYFLLIYIVLLNYNRHEEKAKNYVEENSNRVTVTLVNSNKTLINKSSKKSNTKRAIPQQHLIPLKTPIKIKNPIKRVIPPKPNIKLRDRAKQEKERVRQAHVRKAQIKKDKAVAKERARQAQIKKGKAVKERARQARIKKDKAVKERARQAQIKKDKAVAKERARQAWIKKDKAAKKREAKKEQERLARIAKEKEATKRANQERARATRIKKERADKKERERLARIKEERDAVKRAERAREREREARLERERIAIKKEKERQARIRRERERRQAQRANDLFSSVNTHQQRRVPVVQQSRQQQSRVHHSSVADRIKNSYQSGRTSTRNRDSGVKNAYIAKVKRHLNNWSAQSNYKGNSATIRLTIRNSGKFRYVITRTSSGSLSAGLREFLDQLNRMGLGRHDKSSAYVITVHFKAN